MGRNNKRIDAEIDFDIEEPKHKGTSYQRKQKEIARENKKNNRSKHTKRLDAYSDSSRARSNSAVRNYMQGKLDEYDF